MSGPIRVLIVEDSAFTRKALGLMLRTGSDIEVAGEARDGEEAIRLAERLRPDVITMDLDMPRLDGYSAIAELRRRGLTAPVLVVSSLAVEGAEPALRALAAGAADCIPKPEASGSLGLEAMERELLEKVRGVAGRGRPAPALPARQAGIVKAPVRLVVVGSSTGGVEALTQLLSALPENFPAPIVVAQHIPQVFSPMLAQRLDRVCPVGAKELSGDDRISGCRGIFIARGQCHAQIVRDEEGFRAKLVQEAPGRLAAPSVDLLFESAVEAVGARHILAVVLTGMGEDGAQGALRVHRGGGRVYVQDQASSVVWGMPGAVVRAGAAHAVLSLPDLSSAIRETLP